MTESSDLVLICSGPGGYVPAISASREGFPAAPLAMRPPAASALVQPRLMNATEGFVKMVVEKILMIGPRPTQQLAEAWVARNRLLTSLRRKLGRKAGDGFGQKEESDASCSG